MPIALSEGSVFLAKGMEPWQFVCAGLGDVTLPAGDTNTVYNPAPDYGGWEPVRIVRGAPGAPTTTVTIRLETPRDKVLQILRGPVALRVNFARSGARSDPLNYQSAIILTGGEVTNKTISAPVSLDPSTDVVNATIDFSFTDYLLWEPPARRVLSGRNVIAVNAEPSRPGSACEPPIECLQYLYGIDNTSFLFSYDGGLSWGTTALPFTPTSVAKFGRYYFIGGGVTNAPAVIARSTDGVNFVVTELTTPADAVVTSFARSSDGIIYATTSNGYLFASKNSGGSWASVYEGAVQLNRVTAGKVWTVAVGNSGTVVYGHGTSFTGVTVGTDNFVGIAENWRGLFVLASATGVTLWAPTVPPMQIQVGAGINSLAFIKGLIGIAPSDSAIYVTEDGGISWYQLQGASGGQNAVTVDCSSWLLAATDGVVVVEPTRVVC